MTTVSLPVDALLDQASARPARSGRSAGGWPFQAAPEPAVPPADEVPGPDEAAQDAVAADAREAAAQPALSQTQAQIRAMHRRMFWDVVMVLAWGALIPGLMWLGAAAGF